MKQYLDNEQASKLIDLGFEKPSAQYFSNVILGVPTYTIGELLKMLPKIHPSYHDPYCLDIGFDTIKWIVGYSYDNGYVEVISSYELIDALYDMVITLKEDGVI